MRVLAALGGALLTSFLSAAPHAARTAHAEPAPARAPDVRLEVRVAGGAWRATDAVAPLKGQSVELRVAERPGAEIRWYQLVPDLTRNHQNANFPWEKRPYEWTGWARVEVARERLAAFDGRWTIQPFPPTPAQPLSRSGDVYARDDVGSFWFQAEVVQGGVVHRSPGLEESDARGLSPRVLRVSVREQDGYLGWLTSFYNVPALFGSVPYQSNHYLGVDCADVLIAARGQWKGAPEDVNYNVARLVGRGRALQRFAMTAGVPDRTLRWNTDVRPGDWLAVRYAGWKQYGHIGALYADQDGDGLLGPADLVLHAGPVPLHLSALEGGTFDGEVVVLRP